MSNIMVINDGEQKTCRTPMKVMFEEPPSSEVLETSESDDPLEMRQVEHMFNPNITKLSNQMVPINCFGKELLFPIFQGINNDAKIQEPSENDIEPTFDFKAYTPSRRQMKQSIKNF